MGSCCLIPAICRMARCLSVNHTRRARSGAPCKPAPKALLAVFDAGVGTRRGLASPKSRWAEGRNGWVERRSASGGGSRVSQMLRWTRRQERKCARNRTRLPVTTAADQTVAAPESGKPPLPRKPCLASSALLPKTSTPVYLLC